jgi:hypothetical protein
MLTGTIWTVQVSKDRIRSQTEGSGNVAADALDGYNLVQDDLILTVQSELGQHDMDKRNWKKAAMFFVQSKQVEKLAECLFRLGDYDMLADVQAHCADHSNVHEALAHRYQAAGMCSEAVTSFLKVLILLLCAFWVAREQHVHKPRS